MKRNEWLWSLAGFAFVSLGGTLLHYLYNWTGQSTLVAPFSGINESTWEHMKLLFWPLFVFALIQAPHFKQYKSFWCVKLLGTVVGIFSIPVLFYTYNGTIGKSPDWINIVIFFVSAAITFILETILLKKDSLPCRRPWLAVAVFCVIGTLFVAFTFITPRLPLFMDPVTGTYGR